MIHTGPAGHPGGTLSVTEIVTALYFSEINVKPEQPDWPERDRVVLSKGHACAALYSALGLRGFFPIKEFEKFKRIDGLLEGHPTIDIPGVDAVSGSLGMGLSQGLGMALGARHSQENYRAYVILGDGDLQEGATWEALMAAGHHKLNNLCAILDYNKLQQEGQVDSMMNFAPLDEKVAAFHWSVIEVDGFDFNQLQNAFSKARAEEKRPEDPEEDLGAATLIDPPSHRDHPLQAFGGVERFGCSGPGCAESAPSNERSCLTDRRCWTTAFG